MSENNQKNVWNNFFLKNEINFGINCLKILFELKTFLLEKSCEGIDSLICHKIIDTKNFLIFFELFFSFNEKFVEMSNNLWNNSFCVLSPDKKTVKKV